MALSAILVAALALVSDRLAIPKALKTLRDEAEARLVALEGGAETGGGAQPQRIVRGVVTANVASLAAFTVAGNDGLTYVAGERVLLAGQTAGAECGIYVVGTVGGGTAPLTRAADLPVGPLVNGIVVEVSEGTGWQGSSWKALATGAIVIGTGDPLFYPRKVRRIVTLVTGTVTLGAGGDGVATPVFSTAKSTVGISQNTPNTTTSTTEYCAPSASRVAGKAGTGAVLVRANVAAGTINAADISTLDVEITNW